MLGSSKIKHFHTCIQENYIDKGEGHLNHQDLCEISSSHGGEYDVQSCLLGCTAVILHSTITQKTALNIRTFIHSHSE
jgi:hypothetical protein